MKSIRLHSANNDFQRIEVLRRNRQKRQHYGEFFVEGVRPINLALRHGWDIQAFVYSSERGLSDWAKDILRNSTARKHFDLPDRLAEQLSGKTDASELMAIVRMPEDDPSRIPRTSNPLVVVFDRPSSPGNLGSLIRSSDALGVDGLLITGHGADLYDPETISASRGSLFALPTVRVAGPRELDACLRLLRQTHTGVSVIAMDEEADVDIWSADLSGPTVLLLGNEKWGLSAGMKELATVMTRIPMEGAASSLNVAAAGSIALYEIRRQRRGLV
ncbi:MAG: TrmH family RNA methyltransferase [Chloroflexota bacterium]